MNECHFWDCASTVETQISSRYCVDHWGGDDYDNRIDDCPMCGRGKWEQYPVCLDCNSPRVRSSNRPTATDLYEPEFSPDWKEQEGWGFYVYVLALSDRTFYVGHTDNLRARLSEHRDNRTKSTAGRKPELVWFLEVPDRQTATAIEADMKRIRDKNERMLRDLIIGFSDLVKETYVYKVKKT